MDGIHSMQGNQLRGIQQVFAVCMVKYGRTVGKIMVKGVDANLEQVNAGMAWQYKNIRRNSLWMIAMTHCKIDHSSDNYGRTNESLFIHDSLLVLLCHKI